MRETQAGDLFACRWEADDEEDRDSFRIVQVEGVCGDELRVRAYGDVFLAPPASVDVTSLRQMRLHESFGGAIAVPKAKFRSWNPVRVARA